MHIELQLSIVLQCMHMKTSETHMDSSVLEQAPIAHKDMVEKLLVLPKQVHRPN